MTMRVPARQTSSTPAVPLLSVSTQSSTVAPAAPLAAAPLAAAAAPPAIAAPSAPAAPRPEARPLGGVPAGGERLTLGWTDRVRSWRDRLFMNAAFQRWTAVLPFTRPVARRRARAVFDLCAGFVYSQTLAACLRLELFALLRDGPLTLQEIAGRTGLPAAGAERLLRAAASLQLVERRGSGWALGAVGAPLATNRELAALVRHHGLLYEDLRDPVALLRSDGQPTRATSLAAYWPYAGTGDPRSLAVDEVGSYSQLMSATVMPVVEELLDAYDFGRHRALLDVGGGEGTFAAAAATRHAGLAVSLFDLPAVAERAQAALAARGLGERVRAHGGSFHGDPLPGGADVATLVRVLLDHPDEAAVTILRRVHAALPPGGTVVIAEPLAGERGAEPVGDAYFGFYLLAMGRGRARTLAEHTALLEDAGFRRVRRHPTRYAIQTGVVSAQRG